MTFIPRRLSHVRVCPERIANTNKEILPCTKVPFYHISSRESPPDKPLARPSPASSGSTLYFSRGRTDKAVVGDTLDLKIMSTHRVTVTLVAPWPIQLNPRANSRRTNGNSSKDAFKYHASATPPGSVSHLDDKPEFVWPMTSIKYQSVMVGQEELKISLQEVKNPGKSMKRMDVILPG